MPDLATWRRQLYEVAGLLSAYRTTSFWVGEYTADMTPRFPVRRSGSGIVELTREQLGTRDFRFLRIRGFGAAASSMDSTRFGSNSRTGYGCPRGSSRPSLSPTTTRSRSV